MNRNELFAQNPTPELELFQTDLSQSSWFWLAVILIIGDTAFLLVEALTRHFVTKRHVSLAFLVLLLAGELIRSVRTYRYIRSLKISWRDLEPDSVLVSSLAVVARSIDEFSKACIMISLVVVGCLL